MDFALRERFVVEAERSLAHLPLQQVRRSVERSTVRDESFLLVNLDRGRLLAARACGAAC
jgi:hypothetical protein